LVATLIFLILVAAVITSVFLYKRYKARAPYSLIASDGLSSKKYGELAAITGLRVINGIELKEKIGRGAFAEVEQPCLTGLICAISGL
jgi:hypothetical protein